jgi:hypothetical protein
MAGGQNKGFADYYLRRGYATVLLIMAMAAKLRLIFCSTASH